MPLLLNSSLRNSHLTHLVFSVSLLCSFTLSAGVQDDRFFQYVDDACTGAVTVPITQELADLCSARNNNSSGSSVPIFDLSLGTSSSNKHLTLANYKDEKSIEERLAEIQEEQEYGLVDDSRGWGLLLAAQRGEADRVQSDLESGFNSELSGITIGVDYSFASNFILGIALSRVEDEGVFLGGTGDFSTDTTSVTIYGSWLLSRSIGMDFYVGTGASENANSRDVLFGSIDGVVDGAFDSSQSILGASIYYTYNIKRFGLGIFAALDASDSEIDAYTETGLDPDTGVETLLELQYPEQNVDSATTSVGLRMDYKFYFGWGAIIPGIQYSVVNEKRNDKRFINSALPFTPDYFFVIETDDPDRRYNFLTLSLVLVTNSGMQGFINVEQRSGDDFLETLDTTVGLLYQF